MASASSSQIMASPPLISTDCNGLLRLPNVVTELDGTTLGSIKVTSHSAQPLLVKLESSAPHAVTFQLENENLRHGTAVDDDDPDDWNALFNEVGHVSELRLPPNGSTALIVSFRPKPLIDATEGGLMEHETSSKNRPFGETVSERHAIQEARASIHLIAVPEQPPPVVATGGAPRPEEPGQPRQLQQQLLQPGQPQLAPPLPPLEALPMPLQQLQQQQLSASSADSATAQPAAPVVIVLSARHCVSLLRTDAHELSFDHVVVGSTAVKDFTVWNCSEVPLRFKLALSHQKITGGGAADRRDDRERGERGDGRGGGAVATHDARPEIGFFDADSGVPLPDAGHLVLGYSHTRVRAHLTPKEVGHFPMKLAVHNLMDGRNRETLRVHVTVSSTAQEVGRQAAGDRQQAAGSRRRAVGSKQCTADGRKQATGSRQQAACSGMSSCAA